MTFLKPVKRCYSSELTTGLLASDKVKSNILKGRHTVYVLATSDCRIGGEEVLTKKTVGMLLKEGESITIPVDSNRCDQLYVNGACDIVEFF